MYFFQAGSELNPHFGSKSFNYPHFYVTIKYYISQSTRINGSTVLHIAEAFSNFDFDNIT